MIDIAELGIAVDSSQVRNASKDLDNLSKSGSDAEKAVTGLSRNVESLVSVTKLLAGAFVSLKIKDFLQESISLNQRYQELGITLAMVSKNAGLSAKEVDSVADAVRKSGITMIESRQIVTKLVTAQIDLSNATKLARLAQDAAVVGQLNSSQALDAMIHGITSAQVEVLRTIGINVNFEQSYKKLAGEIGTTSGALSEQQKMQARVNVVMEEATKLSGIYEAAMDNAGKQMRSTTRIVEDMKVKIGGLFDQTAQLAVSIYYKLLKDVDSAVTDLTNSPLVNWSAGVARGFAFMADVVRSSYLVIKTANDSFISLIMQGIELAKGNFGEASALNAQMRKEFNKNMSMTSEFRDMVEAQIVQKEMLVPAINRETNANKEANETIKKQQELISRGAQIAQTYQDPLKKLTDKQKELNEVLKSGAIDQGTFNRALSAAREEYERETRVKKQAVSESERFSKILIEEADSAGIAAIEISKLKEAKSGITELAESYILTINKESDAYVNSSELAVNSQKQIQSELINTEEINRETTDKVSQLWIQSVRNIQTTLSNSIFMFFDNGLKGLVDSVKRAVLQIGSEFAGLKIGQYLGLDKIMSGSASVGSLFSGGATLNSLFGFGKSATQLSAERGALGLWGSSGATKSSGLFGGLGSLGGTSIGAISGAAAALMASIGIGSSIAGDKKMFGLSGTNTSMIGAAFGGPVGAVLAGTINALFGHGPMKFRQQSLQGTASIDGFDGDFTNVYRAKGGLFVGNKHKSVSQGLTQDQQDVFDQALDAFYGSAHSFAQKLGLNVDLVDGFTKEFQIKSEKNQQLTAESIQNMLNGVGNDIAKNVLPIVDTFRKTGEDSFATLRRLNDEFVSLENAVMDLGATSSYATNLVSKLSIEQRTGIVEMAGGVERLSSLTGFFAENFLTNEERFGQANERLQNGLKALGIQTGLTNDQFKAIIQSLDTSNETRIRLLELAPVLLTVNNYLAETTKALDGSTQPLKDSAEALNRLKQEALELAKTNLSNAFSILQRTVQGERDKLTKNFNNSISSYNERINVLTNSIGKLRSFVDSIKSTVNDMRPMELDKAKSVINEAIKKKSFDSQELQFAIGGMKNIPTQNFTNSYDYNLAKSKAETLISELGISAEGQLTNEERQLKVLNDQKQILEDNYKNEMNKLDSIIQKAQDQIDKLSGIDKSIFTLVQAIGNFNRNSIQAGTGLIGSGNVSGNANISNKEIVDFANAPGRTDMDIYNAAKKYGVSFEQYAQATGKNLQDLYKWAASKGLPTFESGGFHSGGARIVGEKGPEMEFTGPSNIISNKEMLKMFNNDNIVRAIGRLYELMEGSYKESKSFARTLRNVTQGGNSLITTPAV